MRRLGIGYRKELQSWLSGSPRQVGNLEITAEHFFDDGHNTLRKLAADYPLFVHGLGLSLGTPGPLCEKTLRRFADVAAAADARWVSEHVAFTRTADVDLGHLNPVPRTQESLDCLVDHARQVAGRCGRPIVLENITSALDVGGEIEETDFLNRLCDGADCGLLLDVTNLFINSKNHAFDPLTWLHEIEPNRIVQLHVVGYSKQRDRYHDHHSAVIQDDLMELIAAVLDYADVQAVTLERDERLDQVDEIVSELSRLEKLIDAS